MRFRRKSQPTPAPLIQPPAGSASLHPPRPPGPDTPTTWVTIDNTDYKIHLTVRSLTVHRDTGTIYATIDFNPAAVRATRPHQT